MDNSNNCTYNNSNDDIKMAEIKRGDIYFANLGEPKTNKTHVQCFNRPVVIISNNKNNKFSPIVMVIPLTSKMCKNKIPTHTLIRANKYNGLTKDSIVLAEQILTIDKINLISKIGTMDELSMAKIDKCFMVGVGIEIEDIERITIREKMKKELLDKIVEEDKFICKVLNRGISAMIIKEDIKNLNNRIEELKVTFNENYVRQYERVLNRGIM